MQFLGLAAGGCFLLLLYWIESVRQGKIPISRKLWPLFLFVGFVLLFASVLASDLLLSGTLGMLGCACFFSIAALIERDDKPPKP